MVHHLKIWPNHFQDVVNDLKTFELRKNDRDFQIRDTLHLLEYEPDKNHYTGHSTYVTIHYMTPPNILGLYDDYVILGIKRIIK